jgi:hypothetical protein
MTAVAATFGDFKLVKTRKVAQLILEMPIEHADAALEALGGLPRADKEIWVGVARLHAPPPKALGAQVDTEEAIEASKSREADPKPKRPSWTPPRRRWDDLPAAQQAGILCTNYAFREYIRIKHNPRVINEDMVTSFVRDFCGVVSRADLDKEPYARNKWDQLAEDFDEWRKHRWPSVSDQDLLVFDPS